MKPLVRTRDNGGMVAYLNVSMMTSVSEFEPGCLYIAFADGRMPQVVTGAAAQEILRWCKENSA